MSEAREIETLETMWSLDDSIACPNRCGATLNDPAHRMYERHGMLQFVMCPERGPLMWWGLAPHYRQGPKLKAILARRRPSFLKPSERKGLQHEELMRQWCLPLADGLIESTGRQHWETRGQRHRAAAGAQPRPAA